MNKELLEKIAEIIARECTIYADGRVEKERCTGAAARILCLVEEFRKQSK